MAFFPKATDLQAVRLAKGLCGLSGHRCRSEHLGNVIALYPAGICQVIFIGYQDDDLPSFGRPASDDDVRVPSCETGPFAVSSI